MLALFILLLAVIIILIIGLIRTFSRAKGRSTIPGPDVSDPLRGHLAEITASGSLHEYLRGQHQKYGPITHFSLGPTFCVSIASPGLLREQARVFDRPKELYKLIEPVLSAHSVQYANGADGRKRHSAYSRCFSHESLRKRFHILQKLCSTLCTKWTSLPAGQHIPLTQEMCSVTIPGILGVCFGEHFADSKEVSDFKEAYDATWSDLEAQLDNDAPDPKREERLKKHNVLMKRMLGEAVEHSRRHGTETDMFVHVVQEINDSQHVIDADMLTMCVGGFHTTSLLMAWCLYFLAENVDVQEKVCEEVRDLVGDDEITFDAVASMKYTRQVLDETLRCSVLAPSATRVQDQDIELGGHKVPAGTPVIQALGTMHGDEKLWPSPNKFDPERFSDVNRKSLPSYAFEPFGFAGKRKCPGYRLSYFEAALVVGNIVRKFKVRLVAGQKVEFDYGLITKPKEEIWITLEERMQQ